jgi:hypothetical protein
MWWKESLVWRRVLCEVMNELIMHLEEDGVAVDIGIEGMHVEVDVEEIEIEKEDDREVISR